MAWAHPSRYNFAMSAAQTIASLSPEAYLRGEMTARHKHEYVEGRVYMMAGASNAHNMLAMAFSALMFNKLRGKPCQPFNSDTKLRVRLRGQTRFYYPDGMVVCEANPQTDVYQDRPVIIAEVLSPGTRRADEHEKREAYQSIPTLMTYLMIESSRPRVIVCRRQPDGQFSEELYEGLDATIPLPAIEVSLSVGELYERVQFPVDESVEQADELEP
jgi:Uma2 family endonuclease